MTAILIAVQILTVLTFRVTILKSMSRLNPCWYFSIANLIMGVGTVLVLDWTNKADETHGIVITLSLLCYSIAAAIALRSSNNVSIQAAAFWDQPVQPLSVAQLHRLKVLLLISAAVCSAYYIAIGYNLQFLALRNFVTGTTDDYTTLRLQTYAGDRYLAPGYVNQFKNMIFPLGVSILIAHRSLRSRRQSLSSFALLFVSVIFLAGTGQRAAFVLWVFASVLLFVAVRKPRWQSWFTPRRLVYVAVGFAIFSGLSVTIGRIDSSDSLLIGAIENVRHRVFYSNQLASAAGFRVVYDLPIAYGREWATAASGILPGNRGSDLSSIVYEQLFGGRRGTAPVSIWGSAWYNFGWAGVTIFPAILGVVHATTYTRFVAGRREIGRLGFYAGLTMLLSTWIAGSFMYLLNAGGIGLVILGVTLQRRAPDEARVVADKPKKVLKPVANVRG